MADPYKDKVVLSLPMEGAADGSLVFNDRTGKTVTVNGNTHLSTDVTPPWGKTSAYFDGTGDYLQFPSSSDFTLGAGDFTIEAWVYRPSGTYTEAKIICGKRAGDGTTDISFVWYWNYVDDRLHFDYSVNGSTQLNNSALTSATIPANTWTHTAFVRRGAVGTFFVNGVADATTVSFGSNAIYDSACNLAIGARLDGLRAWLGYIKDLRITKGVARYTGNFTPSQMTTVDDDYWANVVLAIHGEGTGTTFTDVSNNAATVTTTGNTTHSTAVAPPFGTSSIYFDGTGDYLSLAASADWAFGAGDFSIEGWFRPGDVANNRVIAESRAAYVARGWVVVQTAAAPSKLSFFAGDSNDTAWEVSITGATTLVVGTWYHFAVVRSGSTFLLFLNGAVDGSATWAGTVDTTSAGLLVGCAYNTTLFYSGYIKDLRITKGIARYTQNFNPWRVVDPYYKNIVLQISGEGSGTTFYDGSPNAKTVTTNGNTTHSTAVVPPFGSSSIYFDGSGDYLSLADSADWELDDGDFTIEMWVRPTTGSPADYQGLVSHEDQNSPTTYGWLFITDNSISDHLFFTMRNGGNPYKLEGTALTGGVWQHVAVTRQNGVARLFQDGVKVAEATYAFTVTNNSQPLRIGALSSNSVPWAYFSGYIKDLRITKGVAKYTSDFTPAKVPALTKSDGRPTAFPDKTAIKTIAKPLPWDEPEPTRIML